MTKPKPMTAKEREAEAAFADKIYKDRARINRLALAAIVAAGAGSRQVTIRLANSEIELAKQQAAAKGLPYQMYIKLLLHQTLIADR